MRSRRIFERMERSLDRSFSEKIKFTPIKTFESVSSLSDVELDTDRPEMTVDCIFETSFIQYRLGNNYRGNRADSFNDIIDDYPICLLRKDQLPYDLLKNDQVELVGSGDKFVVSDIKPDSIGRLLIELKIADES